MVKSFEEWLVTESTNGYIEGEEITYEDMCKNAEEYALYFMKQEDLARCGALLDLTKEKKAVEDE